MSELVVYTWEREREREERGTVYLYDRRKDGKWTVMLYCATKWGGQIISLIASHHFQTASEQLAW